MSKPPNHQGLVPLINRIADIMSHTNRYSCIGVKRLAEDANVNASSLSRIINNQVNPSFATVVRITEALEQQLGFRIDPRDIVAEGGRFLTRFACDLVRCKGCLPDSALDDFGDRKLAFVKVQTGQWVTSRYPNGFTSKGEKHE